MRETFPMVRRAAIILIAACSVVSALFLVWLMATRENIGSLSNGHLLGMIALFLLPGATAAAWELDRRTAEKIPEEEERPGEPPAPEPARRKPVVHEQRARPDSGAGHRASAHAAAVRHRRTDAHDAVGAGC